MGEGFGMIFHESMACGVPVLTTDCSACPDTLNGMGYLMSPEVSFHHADGTSQAVVSGSNIASNLLKIYGDRKVLNSKAISGKTFVSQFTPENQAKKLDNIIKEVVSKNYEALIRQ